MKHWALFLALAFLAIAVLSACGQERPSVSTSEAATPSRIVSLDYCADQYVLKLADREAILAVSPDADASFSYMRAAARGLPQTRAAAEDVLALRPDLIVRSYGGGPNATAFFQRAGVPVLQVGYAGSVADIEAVTRDMATGLGQTERGEALIADMNTRLATLKVADASGPATLYMTPGGVTSGPGSLVHDMLARAGLNNFETRPGWHALPLERLAAEQPEHVAASFYSDTALAGDGWSSARHPIARRQTETVPTTRLEGAWTACGSWFLLDAIEALAREATDD